MHVLGVYKAGTIQIGVFLLELQFEKDITSVKGQVTAFIELALASIGAGVGIMM